MEGANMTNSYQQHKSVLKKSESKSYDADPTVKPSNLT